jgi:23S rRNA (pseudouridine1915-N3)-methyltransferase
MTRILCIGKKHDALFSEAISHYERKLLPYSKIEWIILPQSSLEGTDARNEESGRILKRLNVDDYAVLLDETGDLLSSHDIAHYTEEAQNRSKSLTYIIGGSYGVSEHIKTRADVCVAFGRVVFPHQLMRVLVVEQIYRAHSILAGSKYHHD